MRLARGGEVELGPLMASGGEGRIHEVVHRDGVVAKVYHKPVAPDLRAKLAGMVQMCRPELSMVAAWPVDLLLSPAGECVGFLMPRVAGPGVIDRLSHPGERARAFPTADFKFLVCVGKNLMHAAAALHAAGCVIGDVNERNVYVLTNGTVRFLDADSFQLARDGRVFACDVGTPLFTPPELQGRSLRGVIRTPSQDIFGLAVLVFQLLIQGCHPFAGTPRDGSGGTIEEAITAGRYAHSEHLQSTVSPPPDRLPVRSLGEVSGLFERAFRSTARPTADEWARALAATEQELLPCQVNRRHAYLRRAPSCPLCGLARDPLPAAAANEPPFVLASTLNIGDLIREAGRIEPLRSVEARCNQPALVPGRDDDVPAAVVRPSRVAVAIVPRVKSQLAGAGVFGILAGAGLLFAKPPLGLAVIVGGVIVAGIGSSRAMAAQAAAQTAAQAAADEKARALKAHYDVVDADLARARDRAAAAVDRLRTLEAEARHLDHDIGLTCRAVVAGVATHLAALQAGDAVLAQAVSQAEATYRQERMREHLRCQTIAAAAIPDIGPSRKATLASYGIESAADVNENGLGRLPGFGPQLRSRLMQWRRQCESACHEARAGAPATWVERLRRDHAAKIAASAAALRGALTRYQSERAIADPKLTAVARGIDAARAGARDAMDAVRKAWAAC